jgi:hypothetical protein
MTLDLGDGGSGRALDGAGEVRACTGSCTLMLSITAIPRIGLKRDDVTGLKILHRVVPAVIGDGDPIGTIGHHAVPAVVRSHADLTS